MVKSWQHFVGEGKNLLFIACVRRLRNDIIRTFRNSDDRHLFFFPYMRIPPSVSSALVLSLLTTSTPMLSTDIVFTILISDIADTVVSLSGHSSRHQPLIFHSSSRSFVPAIVIICIYVLS